MVPYLLKMPETGKNRTERSPVMGSASIAKNAFKLTGRRCMRYFSTFSTLHFRPVLMVKASTPAAPQTPPTFESALQELEAIVQAMESGNAPLEESLGAYERGIALLRQCQDTLAAAEKKLQILENGVLRDFDVGNTGNADD